MKKYNRRHDLQDNFPSGKTEMQVNVNNFEHHFYFKLSNGLFTTYLVTVRGNKTCCKIAGKNCHIINREKIYGQA